MTGRPACPNCGKPTTFQENQNTWMVRPVVGARESDGGVLTIGGGYTEDRIGPAIYLTDCCFSRVTREQIIEAYKGVESDPFECLR